VVLILMGVSGTGKSTVGKILAGELGWDFVEGDDFHPPANVEKMKHDIPLTDADRAPWLEALRERIKAACAANENVILACSALKRSYQDLLEEDAPECVEYVYLHGSPELLRRRLEARENHFADAGLLASQLATLEPPADAVRVEVTPPPEEIAATIRRALRL
jgi:gluconokinase